MLRGVQQVSKFKEQDRNTVVVCLAVLRLPSVDSDIVIHYNCPASLAPASSSAAVASVHAESVDVAGGTAGGNGEGGQGEVGKVGLAGAAETSFRRMLSSLIIQDWGLFEAPDMSS